MVKINRKVGGSNPPIPTILYPGLAQFGRALDLGSRGREFESRISDHMGCPPIYKTKRHTQQIYIQYVMGSSPIFRAIFFENRTMGSATNEVPCLYAEAVRLVGTGQLPSRFDSGLSW